MLQLSNQNTSSSTTKLLRSIRHNTRPFQHSSLTKVSLCLPLHIPSHTTLSIQRLSRHRKRIRRSNSSRSQQNKQATRRRLPINRSNLHSMSTTIIIHNTQSQPRTLRFTRSTRRHQPFKHHTRNTKRTNPITNLSYRQTTTHTTQQSFPTRHNLRHLPRHLKVPRNLRLQGSLNKFRLQDRPQNQDTQAQSLHVCCE